MPVTILALTISAGTRPGAGAPGAANIAAWEAVIDQAMGVLGEGLHTLMDAGLPPPDEVGYELRTSRVAWRPKRNWHGYNASSCY